MAELVLRVATARRISLHQATLEVRNSQNAWVFPSWCAELFNLGEEGGLRARSESRGMIKDLTRACETWASDVSEGRDYRTRRLRLGDIPLVGKILKAAGMDEVSVKVPVIIPGEEYRYFLFLNDLLRSPQKAA